MDHSGSRFKRVLTCSCCPCPSFLCHVCVSHLSARIPARIARAKVLKQLPTWTASSSALCMANVRRPWSNFSKHHYLIIACQTGEATLTNWSDPRNIQEQFLSVYRAESRQVSIWIYLIYLTWGVNTLHNDTNICAYTYNIRAEAVATGRHRLARKVAS